MIPQDRATLFLGFPGVEARVWPRNLVGAKRRFWVEPHLRGYSASGLSLPFSMVMVTHLVGLRLRPRELHDSSTNNREFWWSALV